MNFLSNINLNKNEIQNVVIHNLASDPASGKEGQLIYRTDIDVIKYHDGTQWVEINSGSITQFSVAGDTGTTTIVDLDTLTINTGSDGISTSVSGDTLTISLADITNAELQNDSISITNSDGHLVIGNSGTVALGGTIAIETQNLVDTVENQTIGGDKTFSGDTVFNGDVTINGTTTTVDSANLIVEDPLIVVAKNQTGATPSLDAGIIVERGDLSSMGMFWDESSDKFVFADVGSEDGSTSGDVTISSYANLQAGNTEVSQLTVNGLTQNNAATSMIVENAGILQKADISTLIGNNAVSSLSASGTAPLNLSVDQSTDAVTLSGSVDLATDTQARSSTSDEVLVTPGNLRALSHVETISGDALATSFTVNHGLGTRDVIVQLYDTSTFETVFADVTRTDTSNVDINFGFAPVVGANYRVLINIAQ